MLVYQLDDIQAFELLRLRSQATNIKLRTLAQQLLSDFASVSAGDTLPPRSTFDELLITVHQRCADDFTS